MLLTAKQQITKNYDCIIIGSGLAGMTAANKLAKNGRAVLLLESHNKLGGFATWFKRKAGEHIFDVSLHGFPAGMKKTCRKYWNKEIADDIVPLRGVRFSNPQFNLDTDFTKEDYKRILIDELNCSEVSVNAFFTDLEQMNFYDAPNITNGEFFERYFPARNDVVRFLMEPIVYANGSTLDDPAITYGIVFSNFMQQGVYTYRGGTDVLIGKMKEELLKNHVDIKMHAKVEEIIIEEGVVKGVYLKGQRVLARSVLSNSNLLSTIYNLAGMANFSESYLGKASKVRLNSSSCQVYMGVRAGENLPFVGDLVFHSDDAEFSTNLLLSPKIGSQTFSMYYPESRPHLKNRYAIVSSSNSSFADWEKLSLDEYELQKKYLIERALMTIEKIIPGVRDKIDFVEAATPLTIKKYTNHLKGASFGTKFEGLEVSQTMQHEVAGLFHSGSVGIIMSGWLGAANYGVMQSYEVENYLN